MQFKHPEILYALFLLVIPIIIHLFQLRKFRKEAFTNVKFLKKVKLQTRKSSQLKKWLVLFTRLFALAALIFAFAQPFIPKSESALKEKETVIYLDNSFSMQQKSNQTELLKKAVQQLLETLPENQKITLFTNNGNYRNVNLTDFKKDLLQIDYTAKNYSLKTIYLKALNAFSKRKDTQKEFIAISDFQANHLQEIPNFNKEINNHLIQLKPKALLNVSIDSVAVLKQDIDNLELKVILSSNQKTTKTVPVSLYNKKNLLAKSSAGFTESNHAETTFTIPANQEIKGEITIENQALMYDNSFYFSLQPAQKINVVSLNGNSDEFLKRVYQNKSLFNFKGFQENQLDYNAISHANLIILNELKEIPAGLPNILQEHITQGGSLSIIPSKNSSPLNYNALLTNLQAGKFINEVEENLKITSINFGSPLYKSVFNTEVKNFQYPSITKTYQFASLGNTLLGYNNEKAFLSERHKIYVFAASLDKENSNFKNSPLIVPTFYNMATQSLALPQLFYSIGKQNTISIPVNLHSDDVLHLKNKEENIIPLQQKFDTKVEITTEELPEKAGIYEVLNTEKNIQNLAYNYNRSESDLKYADLSGVKNVNLNDSIKSYFSESINKNQIDQFWKWFIIFAVFFLILEMLLIKLLK